MHITLKLNREWKSISQALKKQYPVLSASDLEYKRGDESLLVERLSGKLKLPQEEIYSVLMKLKLKTEIPST